MLPLTADQSRHAALTAARLTARPRRRACKNPASWILYRNAMSHCAACSRTSSTLRRLLARALPDEPLGGPVNMFVRNSMRSCLSCVVAGWMKGVSIRGGLFELFAFFTFRDVPVDGVDGRGETIPDEPRQRRGSRRP